MKRILPLVLLSAGMAVSAPAEGADTNQPSRVAAEPMVLADLRVSAIAGVEGQYYVGLVDQKTRQARLLRTGDQIAGYVITEIDPESKAVRLEKGGIPYRLELSGDSVQVVPDDPESAPSAQDVKPGPVKTLEDFLREHPELKPEKGGAAGPVSPARPVTPEEGLRRMSEAAGKPFDPAALKPTTFEDFVRQHAPTNQPKSSP